MKVRLATLESDGPAILAGARDFVSRMDFRLGIPQTDEEIADALNRLLAVGLEIIVGEHEGRIVAGLGAIYGPFPWNAKHLVASELFIWTDRDAPPTALLAMLRFFDQRKRERGATMQELFLLTSSPPHIAKLYARMGLREVQTSWMGPV